MKIVIIAFLITLAGSGIAFQNASNLGTSPENQKAHDDFDREVARTAALIRSLPPVNQFAVAEVSR